MELRCCLNRTAAVVSYALLLAALCAPVFAQADVPTIIKKSVEANNRDWDADPLYDYTEQDHDARGTKTYEVTNVLGTPYERLIAIDGKPLTGSRKAQEQKKYDQMLAQRKSESPQQRAKRISKYQADRHRDHEMLAQLTKAFDFTLEGEQQIEGRKVYVLKATPHHGYRPPTRDTQVLPGMQGKLWVDEETFQWVKVEAHVIRPVSIEGFLAQVEPGTEFELEKTPVDQNIWLTKHFAMHASAKVLFVMPHHSSEDDTYFNYHKSQSPANASEVRSQAEAKYADSRPANP